MEDSHTTPPGASVDGGESDGAADVTTDTRAPEVDGSPSDAGIDVSTDSPTDASSDAADAADAADATDSTDAADGAPALDDAGCPWPTGLLVSLQDAGIPSSGLVLWLRADVGVATLNAAAGGTVCRWDDLSGNGNAFIPATATPPTKSENGLAGMAAVSIPGPEHYLLRADVLGIPATAGRTIAAYGKTADTTTRFQYLTQGLGGSAGTYFGLDQNTFATAGSLEGLELTNNSYDSDLATTTNGRTHVLSLSSFVAGTALPGALTYAVDGTVRTLSRRGGSGNGTVESFAGANFTSIGYAFPGFTGALIGEILVYNRALTPSERTQVEQHFAARF